MLAFKLIFIILSILTTKDNKDDSLRLLIE